MTRITAWAAAGVAAVTLTLAPATAGRSLTTTIRAGFRAIAGAATTTTLLPLQLCPDLLRRYYAVGYYYGQPIRSSGGRHACGIHVVVPPDATVWFAGQETNQTGSERVFESPEVVPGPRLLLRHQAQWRGDDGKEITQTRQVDVQANTIVNVDFTVPAL